MTTMVLPVHPLLLRRAALLLSALSAATAAAAPSVAPTGDPVSVWGSIDSLHKCGVNDTPDIPARAFVAPDGTGGGPPVTHMIIGSTSFHHMTGPSLLVQNRSCVPSWNSTVDPDPSAFAAYEWLDSPHAFPNGTVVAMVHTEYDANKVEQPPCPHNYPLCWTVTVGLAVSNDNGVTWAHARPPPNHLVAAVPYVFNQTQPASGWGDPSPIIQSPLDGFYYMAVVNRNQVGLQAPGICFMRTADLTDPASWRAWGGGAYNVSFVSPYTMPPGEEAQHVCAVSTLPVCLPSGLTYSTYLGLFVATLDCLGSQNGVWIAFSEDLVTWSAAQQFYTISDLPVDVRKNVTSMTYPTFMDPASSDPNFQSIGQNASLFWVSIGHSPYTDGRRLWATPMTFSKA